MKPLFLSILWHMHQPYYRNDFEGRYSMPWTYLHAIKDYHEMVRHLEEAGGGVKAVFNLVPSLLDQIEAYADPHVSDSFLQLMRKPVWQLTGDERAEITHQCFMANVTTMITPLRRFRELYVKRNRDVTVEFTDEELIDLEVLYLLAWTGTFYREELPLCRELFRRERGYAEEDKNALLDTFATAIADIIPLYRRVAEKGYIELSATPHYHPILPLLLDVKSAREAAPAIPLPSVTADFSHEADWHVESAVKTHTARFGKTPYGMWPAEGSISDPAAALFAKHGVRWIASDEDVLGNSLGADLRHTRYRPSLYKRHTRKTENGNITIFFRDKVLSDLIGFTYAGWSAERAVEDFIAKLKIINSSVPFSPHVSVILDGENAWEYYENNAKDFFALLYKKLAETGWITTLTFQEACNHPALTDEPLEKITAGSWIYGTFSTWCGHEEKNLGWELLAMTKRTVDKHIHTVPEDIRQQIALEMHAAEGSDWFWWFGDDHFSMQSDLFDSLFRAHLVNTHKLLGVTVPPELYRPVKRTTKTGLIRKPSYSVTPQIDGAITSFYEWLSAGVFDLKYDTGAMHSSGTLLKTLYFGYDEKNLYLRLEGDTAGRLNDTVCIEMEFTAKEKRTIHFRLTNGCCIADQPGVMVYAGKIIEIMIPLTLVAGGYRDKVTLQMKAMEGETVIERAPLYSAVEIDLSHTFEDEWMV